MKKLFAILLVLVMVLGLAACGGNEAPDVPVETPTEEPLVKPTIDPFYPDGWLGTWGSDDGYLSTFMDGKFNLTDPDGLICADGNWKVEDDALVLEFSDGDTAIYVMDENGDLYGGEDYGMWYRTEIQEPVDLPNGFIEEGYADSWYLFGELGFPSLVIQADGGWEAKNTAGDTVYEGFSFMDSLGNLCLHDPEDMPFAVATLGESGLFLVPDAAYESFYEGYMEGDLVFNRESESMNPESQPLGDEMVGEWLYSAHENIINFHEDGTFVWTFAQGETTGTYTFDGEYVTFIYSGEGGEDVAWLSHEGHLCLDGVEGDYYYKNES